MKQPFTVLALVLPLGVTACALTTPHWDQQFGSATSELFAQQTLNPHASVANADRPVNGIEGQTAIESMDRYYKSFAVPPKPYNVLTIGVTGAQGGGR